MSTGPDFDGAARAPKKPGRKKTDSAGGGADRPPWGEDPDDPCPVRPLGYRDGYFMFFARNGELRIVRARDLNVHAGLIDLFGGNLDWIWRNFRTDKGLSLDGAAGYLVKACNDAGMFDPGEPTRGPGLWRDGGTVIMHCGDRVIIDGETERAGFRRNGALYPRAPAIEQPAEKPIGIADAEKLLEGLRLWNFADPLGPEIELGWIGQARLGGVTDWRPHIMLRAPYGSGKSWEAELIAAAGGARPPSNNFTQASLYQMLTGEARPLVLDEAEHADSDSRIRAVIELIRHMSGRAGARIQRGSADNKPRGYTMTGSCHLSAILHIPLRPEDRSRFVILTLNDLPSGDEAAGHAERALEAIEFAREIGPAIQRRAMVDWRRYLDSAGLYRSAMISEGAEIRIADTIAAIMAGYDLLLHDTVPDGDRLDWQLGRFEHRWQTQTDLREGEGEQCLNYLMSSPVDLYSGGERRTIGQTILDALEASTVDRNDINRRLGAIGLKILWTQDEGGSTRCEGLLVANQHRGLERTFDGTRWRNTAWQQALDYLPGVGTWAPTRFGGALARAKAIPLEHLPTSDDDGGIEIQGRAIGGDNDPLAEESNGT